MEEKHHAISMHFDQKIERAEIARLLKVSKRSFQSMARGAKRVNRTVLQVFERQRQERAQEYLASTPGSFPDVCNGELPRRSER